MSWYIFNTGSEALSRLWSAKQSGVAPNRTSPCGRQSLELPWRSTCLLTLILVTSLAGCVRPATQAPFPTREPAATALAKVFQAEPTPTSVSRIQDDQQSSTPTSVPTTAAVTLIRTPTPAVLGSDPRVDADCRPLGATPAKQKWTADLAIDVSVDLAPTGQRISPLIYGLADSYETEDVALFRDLGTPLLRWGGNQVTRHNWEINASNAAADWNFANVSHDWAGDAPSSAADDFVRRTQSLGAAAILTIPTIGYVARDGDNDTRSIDVPERGGPRLQPGAEAIPGYDPGANQRATSIKSYAAKAEPFAYPPNLEDDVVYQDEWVHHLVETFGRADEGGLQFYALDNEPDLWSHTHRDIHPAHMGYDDMLAMFEEYATAIKAVDPTAKVLGPEIWGVPSLFFSALDADDDNFRTPDDRMAHGNLPFLPWFLEQARASDLKYGQRRLDVLTVHNYPQNGAYPDGNDPATNALRLRSTQQLWDPNYTDESWVSRTEGAKLRLIPRLRDWVNTYYPGTMIGITEWNYGADDTINGGLTIVDVLGIFGREGLDLATYWRYPALDTPGASAFKIYGNYDNCGRHFGDQVLTTHSSDEQTLSAYASRDSYSGDLPIMTVNKLPNKAVAARFDLQGLQTSTVEVYQFDEEHPQIRRLQDVQTEGSSLSYTVPPYTATLFVVKP